MAGNHRARLLSPVLATVYGSTGDGRYPGFTSTRASRHARFVSQLRDSAGLAPDFPCSMRALTQRTQRRTVTRTIRLLAA